MKEKSLAEKLTLEGIELLKNLIKTPSVSRNEDKTAELIFNYLKSHGVAQVNRHLNNVWAVSKNFDQNKPTILFNSHHDTVLPAKTYTRDPFSPDVENGVLYGLGSNDAGGAAINLLSTFLYFYNQEQLPYNLIVAITAEEENSGDNGVQSILGKLPEIEFAVVGEPTSMEISVAEKGILVLDCIAKGKTGHAARNTGINAIYKALEDINWLKNYKFEKSSPWLGDVKCTVTGINAGTLHNVIPAECSFMVDIRITEKYTHQEVLDIIKANIPNKDTEVKPRSFKLKSSHIDENHPLIKLAKAKGFKLFGSPTTSDRAVMPYASLKMGPGDSNRSHTADEYILLSEISEGIEKTINLFEDFFAK
ncbi:MAG: M20 family metallo-hydrolase [Bacteroidales bacterium]|nr:M20 family metallo-hydrolase [Bacteroidales bacterium]